MNRPNILLLSIDTLRADVLSCYGYRRLTTPNLDRLAANGIRFSQAITGGSWTQAAFPVLLTSSYATMYGGCLGRLSPERPSPIEALARNGYTTAGFSTNPHLSKATGYERGFHHFVDLAPNETDPILRHIKGGQHLLRNPLTHKVLGLFDKRMRPARVYTPADEVNDEVYQWLETCQQPFFAWVHYMDVHWPYHLRENLTSPEQLARVWRDLSFMYERANLRKPEAFSPAEREHFIELYLQALQFLDAQIGSLLNHLNKLGHDSNTIIIVVSDHGEEFLDHDRWGHWESNLFDEILKVPLIIRLPNSTKGDVIDQQVRLLDIMPTILRLCGCKPPSNMLGTSMTPLWTQDGTWYEVVESISEMQRPPWHRIAVRTEAFKYIWDNKQPHQPQLYDLRIDPDESQDVSQQYPDEVRRFQVCVDAHLRRITETEPVEEIPELELDVETIRRLRALGYVE